MRHSPETKQQALESIDKVGVKKTQEAMNISAQTLYKWKNEEKETKAPAVEKRVAKAKRVKKEKPEAPVVDERKAAAQQLIQEDDMNLLQKVIELEAENASLRLMNEKLKRMMKEFIE